MVLHGRGAGSAPIPSLYPFRESPPDPISLQDLMPVGLCFSAGVSPDLKDEFVSLTECIEGVLFSLGG